MTLLDVRLDQSSGTDHRSSRVYIDAPLVELPTTLATGANSLVGSAVAVVGYCFSGSVIRDYLDNIARVVGAHAQNVAGMTYLAWGEATPALPEEPFLSFTEPGPFASSGVGVWDVVDPSPTASVRALGIEVDDEPEVLRILRVGEHVISILAEAVAAGRGVFGRDVGARLGALHDRSGESTVSELVLHFQLPMSFEDAKTLIRRFDDEWWIDHVTDADGMLTISFDFDVRLA